MSGTQDLAEQRKKEEELKNKFIDPNEFKMPAEAPPMRVDPATINRMVFFPGDEVAAEDDLDVKNKKLTAAHNMGFGSIVLEERNDSDRNNKHKAAGAEILRLVTEDDDHGTGDEEDETHHNNDDITKFDYATLNRLVEESTDEQEQDFRAVLTKDMTTSLPTLRGGVFQSKCDTWLDYLQVLDVHRKRLHTAASKTLSVTAAIQNNRREDLATVQVNGINGALELEDKDGAYPNLSAWAEHQASSCGNDNIRVPDLVRISEEVIQSVVNITRQYMEDIVDARDENMQHLDRHKVMVADLERELTKRAHEIIELKDKALEAETKMNIAKGQLLRRNQVINEIRSGYINDVLRVKEMLFMKEKFGDEYSALKSEITLTNEGMLGIKRKSNEPTPEEKVIMSLRSQLKEAKSKELEMLMKLEEQAKQLKELAKGNDGRRHLVRMSGWQKMRTFVQRVKYEKTIAKLIKKMKTMQSLMNSEREVHYKRIRDNEEMENLLRGQVEILKRQAGFSEFMDSKEIDTMLLRAQHKDEQERAEMLTAELKESEQTISDLTDKTEDLQRQLKDGGKKHARLEHTISQMAKDAKELEEKYKAAMNLVETLKAEQKRIQDESEKLKDKMVDYEAQMAVSKDAANLASSSLEFIRGRDEMKAQCDELEIKLADSQTLQMSLESEIDRLKREKTSLENERGTLQDSTEALKAAIMLLNDENATLRKSLGVNIEVDKKRLFEEDIDEAKKAAEGGKKGEGPPPLAISDEELASMKVYEDICLRLGEMIKIVQPIFDRLVRKYGARFKVPRVNMDFLFEPGPLAGKPKIVRKSPREGEWESPYIVRVLDDFERRCMRTTRVQYDEQKHHHPPLALDNRLEIQGNRKASTPRSRSPSSGRVTSTPSQSTMRGRSETPRPERLWHASKRPASSASGKASKAKNKDSTKGMSRPHSVSGGGKPQESPTGGQPAGWDTVLTGMGVQDGERDISEYTDMLGIRGATKAPLSAGVIGEGYKMGDVSSMLGLGAEGTEGVPEHRGSNVSFSDLLADIGLENTASNSTGALDVMQNMAQEAEVARMEQKENVAVTSGPSQADQPQRPKSVVSFAEGPALPAPAPGAAKPPRPAPPASAKPLRSSNTGRDSMMSRGHGASYKL